MNALKKVCLKLMTDLALESHLKINKTVMAWEGKEYGKERKRGETAMRKELGKEPKRTDEEHCD